LIVDKSLKFKRLNIGSRFGGCRQKKNMKRLFPSMIFAVAVAFGACSSGSRTSVAASTAADTAAVPAFNADSAFAMVKAQTDFGPRVPGTKASGECGQWLQQRLRQLGAENVKVQKATVTAYDGTRLPINNITAQINPSVIKRILILAHWDSRPWADNDPDPENRGLPIDGANDGASGVGVILELVRIMAQQPPEVGVDILFVDGEDYGPHSSGSADSEDAWALGTQYWVSNPTLTVSDIRYAVLLDMVGGRDACFHREYFSDYYARDVNDKIWRSAARAGESSRFINSVGGAITDDHIYLNRAGVPAVDIIESRNPETGSFNPTWHTLADNLSNIDPATLGAVGNTILNLIYSE